MSVLRSHPLVKTSQDLRRAIVRLEAEIAKNPNSEQAEQFKEVIRGINQVRHLIPNEYQDLDLKRE